MTGADQTVVQKRMRKIYTELASPAESGTTKNTPGAAAPAVSVLMGTYNEKDKADTALAIDSILMQTYTDFEFIICDDGSGQEFYQWLVQFCRKDDRIRLLRNKKNHGLAYTLNKCLKYASGVYIARMDADDISDPDRFEKQTMFLNAHPEYAVAGCSVRMLGSSGIWGVRRMEEMPGKKSFLNTLPFVHPAVMIRRKVLEELHGYCESPKVLRTEDYELFMRLYAAGFCGYNLKEVLLSYREDEQSYLKRKYRYRINECRVRYNGFRRMGILKGNLRYVAKPLAVGLIPACVMRQIRRHRYASGLQ